MPEAVCLMRRGAWDALRVLCGDFASDTVDIGGTGGAGTLTDMAAAEHSTSGVVHMPSVTGPATMAGVEWDVQYHFAVAFDPGLYQCRAPAGGPLALVHTHDPDLFVADVVKLACPVAARLPDLSSAASETERLLVRRAEYVTTIDRHLEADTSGRLLEDPSGNPCVQPGVRRDPDTYRNENLDKASTFIKHRLYRDLMGLVDITRDRQVSSAHERVASERVAVVAGHLLHMGHAEGLDVDTAIGKSQAVFDAAPLALLALVTDVFLTREQKVHRARSIIQCAERCGGFHAPDDARFNLMERFLALGGRSLPLLCETRDGRDLESNILDVTRLLADACIRHVPDYIAASCDANLTGVMPDGLIFPWQGFLLDLGLFDGAVTQTSKANMYPSGHMLTCVAGLVAQSGMTDGPLKAGALQTKWHLRGCFENAGQDTTHSTLLARLHAEDGFCQGPNSRRFNEAAHVLSGHPLVAQGMWQHAHQLRQMGGGLVDPLLDLMLESGMRSLSLSTPDETTRVLDILLAMDWNTWAASVNLQAEPDTGVNLGIARLCCLALAKAPLHAEHAGHLAALAALCDGDAPDQVQALRLLSEVRLRMGIDANHEAFGVAPASPHVPGL